MRRVGPGLRGERAAGAATWLLAVIVVAGTLCGCERQVTLVDRGSDSTGTGGTDSLTFLLRRVPEAWEGGVDDLGAARITAQAVRQDLGRRDPSEWPRRAKYLLDSLSVGVEIAGEPCGLVINLFLRSDPGRGSWPFLIWCRDDPTAPQLVELEGRGLRLTAARVRRTTAAIDLGGAQSGGGDLVAGLFGRARGPRQEPMLFVWSRTGDQWKIVQTLGADSLGGFGEGRFESEGGPIDLVVRTYRARAGFDECLTCPHLWWTHRFTWGDVGFDRVESKQEFSTYTTLVRFLDALETREVNPALFATGSAVVDLARSFEWDVPKGAWRVAPGSETGGLELIVYRGPQESYKVTFEPRVGDWLVSGIESVPRSIE